jgi:hypothetical protein
VRVLAAHGAAADECWWLHRSRELGLTSIVPTDGFGGVVERRVEPASAWPPRLTAAICANRGDKLLVGRSASNGSLLKAFKRVSKDQLMPCGESVRQLESPSLRGWRDRSSDYADRPQHAAAYQPSSFQRCNKVPVRHNRGHHTRGAPHR